MEYQPLTEQSTSAVPQFSPLNQISQRRCKSASYANENAGNRMQTEPECISLPGQISLDLDIAKVKQHAEFLENVSNSAALLPGVIEADEESALRGEDIAGEIKEQNDLTDHSRAQQTPLREGMYREIEQSNIIEESHDVNNEQEIVPVHDTVHAEGSQYSITSSIPTDVTKLDDTHSYFSGIRTCTSAMSSLHSSSANVTKNYQQIYESSHESNTNTPCVRTKPLTLVLYVLCAIMVYPFLLALVPLLLIFKLISFLCCCIPCCRHKRRKTRTAFKQQLPLFFTSHPGGYHTIGIELQEQMDGATFVEYVISKLNNAHSHDSNVKQSIVYRLASVVHQIACFSWWEMGENMNLEEHIQIIRKRITTKTNFTDFIEQVSRNQGTQIGQRRKLWRAYFFPFFKINGSSIMLQVHNSLLSGVDLKDVLLRNFSDGSKSSKHKGNINTSSHPTIAETVLLAPGVVLKHLLRSLLNFRQLSNRYRFAYSSPMHLSEATQIASHCSISLHALFMAPLSQCLRDLFFQKYSSRSVRVAVPVNCSCRHTSLFFINLPLLASQAWDTTRLQNLNREIYRNRKDSSILLSATKFASFALSRCTVDFLASLTLRQADILFNIVHCPNDPHYLENCAISSVMYWPPLFDQVSIGICVMVYEQSFRVCIVTDDSVTDWPDILLKLYIASYSELYKIISI
jgi:hypothetical protein